MWYIFKKDSGKVVASANTQPNINDLNSRGEICIQSDEEYPSLNIKLNNGIIVEVKNQ